MSTQSGDARKRQLLEGPIAILDSLQAVSILAPGPFAQLRSDLVEIRSLFEIDETALKGSVVLPGHTPPRPIDGPSASARLEDCERRADALLSSWTDTLVDSLNEKEMAEQIGYVSDPSARAEDRDPREDANRSPTASTAPSSTLSTKSSIGSTSATSHLAS